MDTLPPFPEEGGKTTTSPAGAAEGGAGVALGFPGGSIAMDLEATGLTAKARLNVTSLRR